jgi:hypothetical protein
MLTLIEGVRKRALRVQLSSSAFAANARLLLPYQRDQKPARSKEIT